MMATLELGTTPGAAAPRARMLRYAGPERWSLDWPGTAGPLTVTREGDTLTLQEAAAPPRTLALQPGPAIDAELAAIQAAGDRLRSEHPRFRTAETERRKRSVLLLLLWAAGCAGLWLWARGSFRLRKHS